MRKLMLFIALILLVNLTRSQNTQKDVCNPINIFPFYEGFNDTTFAPNCWTNRQNDGSSTNLIWKRVTNGTNSTCAPQSGAGMAMFNCWNYHAGIKAMLITPALNIPPNSFQVDFWMYRDNQYSTNKDSVNVYINSDTNLIGASLLGRIYRNSTLSPVETITNQWYHYFLIIPIEYTGMGKHIIFEGVSNYGTNIYIDDVQIREVLPCAIPSGMHLISMSHTSATIGWTSAASVGSWDIEYGPFGFTQGTGTTIHTTTNSVNITGLNGNTKYAYYIKANCNGALGSSYWSDPSSFVTECNPIDVFPIIENFNDTLFAPNCWKNIQTEGVGTNNIWIGEISGNDPNCSPHSAPRMAIFSSGYFQAGTKAILVTAPFLPDTNEYQLNFWMFRDVYYWNVDSLNVYLNYSPDLNNANYLGSIHRYHHWPPYEVSDWWHPYSFLLPKNTQHRPYYIIFEGVTLGGGNIYIDDLEIKKNTCPRPTSIEVTNITSTSARLSWLSLSESFRIKYRNTLDWIYLNSANTSIDLIGLTPNSTYEVQLMSKCNTSDSSFWTNSIYFSTLQCMPQNLPYFENFDNSQLASIPVCTSIETWDVDGNNWNVLSLISSSYPNSLTLFSSFDGRNDWFYTPALNFESDKMYKISFKYGDGIYEDESYNYIEVKCGDTPNHNSMTGSLIFADSIFSINSLIPGEGFFTVPNSGAYYVGFHGFSYVQNSYLAIDDIKIETIVGIPEDNKSLFQVFTINNQLKVTNNNNMLVKSIIIYDILGQEVGTYTFNSTDNILINTNFSVANYIVKIVTDKQVGTYKLFIK